MNRQLVVWKARVLCNNMSAEVYFAAFWEVIGFSGCCCCANGGHRTCRRDSVTSECFSPSLQFWAADTQRQFTFCILDVHHLSVLHKTYSKISTSQLWQMSQNVNPLHSNDPNVQLYICSLLQNTFILWICFAFLYDQSIVTDWIAFNGNISFNPESLIFLLYRRIMHKYAKSCHYKGSVCSFLHV